MYMKGNHTQRLQMGSKVTEHKPQDPEGIIIFHTASGHLYKKTIQGDEKPKGMAA